MIILGTNSIKDTGFDVANSLRFEDDSSDYLNRTPSSSGNRKTWTLSTWIKRSELGRIQNFFSAGSGGNYGRIQFNSDDTIYIAHVDGAATTTEKSTTQVFRDVSAWYHFVWHIDTTQGTASNREKFYINGVQVTDFSTNTIPAQDYQSTINENVAHYIGNQVGAYEKCSCYFAEVVFIDGQALDPTSFGEFDSDSPTIWKPKDVSGLTFGTNGFYLDFEDSSALGNDAAGSNNFTVNNLTAIDQSTDTCTNNFATMNPLAAYYSASTFSEGNLKVVTGSSAYTYDISTIGVASGKWYWEFKYTAAGGDPHNVGHFGISGKGMPTANSHSLGYYSTDYGISADSGGTLYNNNSGTTNSLYNVAIGDIIAFALDLDSGTNTLKYYRNGTEKITINISSSPENGFYFPAFGFTYSAASGTFEANFGGTQSFSISSGNSDANGFGNFEYSVPSGYFSLCTKNLAEFG